MSTYVEVEEFHDQLPGSTGFSPPADQGRLAERIQLKLAEVNRCHQSVSTGITTLMRTAWEVGELLGAGRRLPVAKFRIRIWRIRRAHPPPLQ